MTKKRFHKLLRAWLSNTPKINPVSSETKIKAKLCMQAINTYKAVNRAESTVPYAEIWKVIVSNGAMTRGVGVKRR